MDHLRKIKSPHSYDEDKCYVFSRLASCDKSLTKEKAKLMVDSLYQYDEDVMLEFGMEKFYFILAGFLWQIENNVVDDELAYEAYLDLEDFNTREYDRLVLRGELEVVKKDAKKAYDYIIENNLNE